MSDYRAFPAGLSSAVGLLSRGTRTANYHGVNRETQPNSMHVRMPLARGAVVEPAPATFDPDLDLQHRAADAGRAGRRISTAGGQPVPHGTGLAGHVRHHARVPAAPQPLVIHHIDGAIGRFLSFPSVPLPRLRRDRLVDRLQTPRLPRRRGAAVEPGPAAISRARAPRLSCLRGSSC